MPEETTKKFLIITSDTGGGHSSAAAAIADGLKRFGATDCLVNIARAIEESHFLARKLTDLYNYLLRYHQPLMKYYYQAIERFRPNESSLLFRLTAPYLRQLFEKYCPQVIVSVHPMTQHFLAQVLRELSLAKRHIGEGAPRGRRQSGRHLAERQRLRPGDLVGFPSWLAPVRAATATAAMSR